MRVRYILRLLGETMGGLTRGWYTYRLGDALFIFYQDHAEALHSDRIWTPERYRPMTWVNRTPQQCEWIEMHEGGKEYGSPWWDGTPRTRTATRATKPDHWERYGEVWQPT